MEPSPPPQTKKMAGRGGVEPPLRGPEPRVLPLDDLPARGHCIGRARGRQGRCRQDGPIDASTRGRGPRTSRPTSGSPTRANRDEPVTTPLTEPIPRLAARAPYAGDPPVQPPKLTAL